MPSPHGYHDDDRCDLEPPPRGSPKLLGDMGTLGRFRRTVELRTSGSPEGQECSAMFVRNLMIAHAVLEMGFSHEKVGDAMGLSRVRVTNIILELEARHNKEHPAD
jgi:hypothetical protein